MLVERKIIDVEHDHGRVGAQAASFRLQARHFHRRPCACQTKIDDFRAGMLARQNLFSHRHCRLGVVDLQRFDERIADNDSAPRAIVIDIAIAVAQAEVRSVYQRAVLGEPQSGNIGAVTIAGIRIGAVKGNGWNGQYPSQRG